MDSPTSLSAGHARTGLTGTSFVSEEPSSAFQTPMSSCRSEPMLSGAPEGVSAQLLLSAQQRLREAFACSVAPHSLMTFTTITQEPCQYEGAMPKMSSLDATTDICHFMRALEPHGDVLETHAEASDQPGVCEGIRDSDDESVSSMGDRHTRKRKRRDQSESCASCCKRAGEAAAAQQHLRSVCDDLAAQNAMLRSQLAAAAEALRGERASSQAELHALRQKNTALGAFLPQSVAAFASEVPSSLYTKKGLRAMLD
ncbi:g12737 [Coccomyxa viridis]|uniref:G12737 protein n=1 Tax=Coccomyxa viridis TaxID=1274662 RepID=A0ABP1GB28_9CHLO